jgi:copper chaperone CopZ
LGAYVVSRGPQKRPGTPASDFEARTVTIPIQGMTCASCTARVKRALSAIDGVIEVEVSLEHRHARVRYIDEKVSPERLAAAINELGYKAETPTAGRSQ